MNRLSKDSHFIYVLKILQGAQKPIQAGRIHLMRNQPHSQHPFSTQSQTHSAWNKKDLGEIAKALGQLLDASLTIPGTSIKFGLDPLIGLIPGIGDIISNAIGSSLLFLATKAGVPRVVILRMSLNIAINMIVGAIPIIGDLFSIWFKSNLQNAQLLYRHCQRTAPTPNLSDWLYVVSIVLGMLLLLGITIAGLVWLVSSILGLLGMSA